MVEQNTMSSIHLFSFTAEFLKPYYCRLNDWFACYRNIKYRWNMNLNLSLCINLMLCSVVIVVVESRENWYSIYSFLNYSIILIDDAMLLFELWLLNDMWGFSSPMSSFEFGISVVLVANVHLLICLIARLRLWWLW